MDTLILFENIAPCAYCIGGGHVYGDEWERCLECLGTGFDADNVLEVGIAEGWLQPPFGGHGVTTFSAALHARVEWIEAMESRRICHRVHTGEAYKNFSEFTLGSIA